MALSFGYEYIVATPNVSIIYHQWNYPLKVIIFQSPCNAIYFVSFLQQGEVVKGLMVILRHDFNNSVWGLG